MDTVAGILIGGASRRMGRPKALLEVDGETILERTVRVAAASVGEVVLLGTPLFALPASVVELPLLRDAKTDCGPLGGLCALLSERCERTCLLIACDMPKMTHDLFDRVLASPGKWDAAVCRTQDADGPRWHPCCAAYRSTVGPVALDRLRAGQLSLMGLLDAITVCPVDLSSEEVGWVENRNS